MSDVMLGSNRIAGVTPMNRRYRLVAWLRTGKVVNATRVAERMHVSVETIWRDMKHLRKDFPFIRSQRGIGGGFYVDAADIERLTQDG